MPKQKRTCRNCCFITAYTDPHVLEPYAGGKIEWTCFLTGVVVMLGQRATKKCGYVYSPDDTAEYDSRSLDSIAHNRPLEAFFQDP